MTTSASGGPLEREVRLSATVIAQDEELRIGDCLASLGFCDEVVVVDGGSRDRTRAIALQTGARVVGRPFDDFAQQHAFANANTRGRWILSLDADERVSPSLAQEIRAVVDRTDDAASHAAFELPFQNHFRGIPLRHGGLWPDRHVRLYRRDRCRADPSRAVHEKLLVDGTVGRLVAPVLHFGWTSLAQALQKNERYADAAARALHARGTRGSWLRMIGKPMWRFLRGSLLQLGFLDGRAGALVALVRAHEAFARESRLWELTHFAEAERDRLR